jgi:hypothetical protein
MQTTTADNSFILASFRSAGKDDAYFGTVETFLNLIFNNPTVTRPLLCRSLRSVQESSEKICDKR